MGLGAEHVGARLQLQAARAVDEVEERHLALAAASREAAGDAMRDPRLLAVGERCVRGQHVGRRLDAGELVREGVDAVGAQLVELGAPDGEQLVSHRGLSLVAGERPHAAERDE